MRCILPNSMAVSKWGLWRIIKDSFVSRGAAIERNCAARANDPRSAGRCVIDQGQNVVQRRVQKRNGVKKNKNSVLMFQPNISLVASKTRTLPRSLFPCRIAEKWAFLRSLVPSYLTHTHTHGRAPPLIYLPFVRSLRVPGALSLSFRTLFRLTRGGLSSASVTSGSDPPPLRSLASPDQSPLHADRL